MIQTLDTSSVVPDKAFELWCNFVSSSFLPIDIHRNAAFEAPFDLKVRSTALDKVFFLDWRYQSPFYSDTFRFIRTRNHIVGDPEDYYYLGYTEAKPVTVIQDGKESISYPGSFTLLDTSRPHEIRNPHSGSGFTLYFPRSILQDKLSLPDSTGPRVVPANTGIARLLRLMCTELPETIQHVSSPDTLKILAEQIITLTSLAFQPSSTGLELAQPTLCSLRYNSILKCIDENLHRPDLSPSWVADQLSISRRYLTQLLTDHRTSFNEQRRLRRLQRIAADLAEPRMTQITVLEIAQRYGFSNASHFSRCFKAQFGISPLEYRVMTVLPTN